MCMASTKSINRKKSQSLIKIVTSKVVQIYAFLAQVQQLSCKTANKLCSKILHAVKTTICTVISFPPLLVQSDTYLLQNCMQRETRYNSKSFNVTECKKHSHLKISNMHKSI